MCLLVSLFSVFLQLSAMWASSWVWTVFSCLRFWPSVPWSSEEKRSALHSQWNRYNHTYFLTLIYLKNLHSLVVLLFCLHLIKHLKFSFIMLDWQAVDSRDSVAMALYSQCFSWIIMRINQKIKGKDNFKSIGILDIFGFENFEVWGHMDHMFMHRHTFLLRSNPSVCLLWRWTILSSSALTMLMRNCKNISTNTSSLWNNWSTTGKDWQPWVHERLFFYLMSIFTCEMHLISARSPEKLLHMQFKHRNSLLLSFVC